jgi:hypothetical protein
VAEIIPSHTIGRRNLVPTFVTAQQSPARIDINPPHRDTWSMPTKMSSFTHSAG